MGNLYINVYMVHIDRTSEGNEPAHIGSVIGVAEDRKLFRLPSGGLGIDYQREIREVYRCSAGNLVTTLTGDTWRKEEVDEVSSYYDYEFLSAEPNLELAVERYTNKGSEDNLPNKEQSNEVFLESSTVQGNPLVVSKSTSAGSRDDRRIQKPPMYGPKTLYSLFFSPPEINNTGLDRSIDNFELSTRSSNALHANGVHTIGDLLLFSEFSLAKLSDLGRKSVLEIVDCIHSLGLSLQAYDSRRGLNPENKLSLSSPNKEDQIVPNRLIKKFELSTWTFNVLSDNKIHSIQDLMLLDEDELLKIPNLGENSVREIIEFIVSLATNKLALENSFDPDAAVPLMDVSKLGLSTTAQRRLESASINTIGDLIALSKINVLKVPKLGKTLITEIENKLALLGYTFGMIPNSRILENPASTYIQPKNIGIEAIFPERKKMEDWILDSLPPKRPELLERLVGQLTLEAMGDKLNVTRERVRQLQAKYERRFLQHKEVHIREINCLNLSTSQPCHLFMLPIHSAYFDNIHKYIPNTNSFFAEIFSDSLSRYRIEWIDGDSIVVLKNLPNLEEVINTIIRLNLTDDYDQYLYSVQRTDLRDYIHDRLQVQLPKSNAGKIRLCLRKIFDDSSCLMSLSELTSALLEQFNLKAFPNEVGTAISNLGDIYLFGPHGWGREDKFSMLDESERLAIRGVIVTILAASEGTDIHADELAQRIRDSNSQLFEALEGKLDKYQINWLLKKEALDNSSVKDRGRFLWGYGTNSKRKNVMAVAIDILHQQGKPMETNELKKLMLTQRSLGKNFQLRPTKSQPDLIQLAPNKWGLRNRDLPEITDGMETLLIDAIFNYFKMEGPIIDTAKLTKIIKGVGIDENCSFFIVSRLLLRYTSSSKPEKSKPLRVHISNSDMNTILVIDPEFKGKIPL
ncbi:helix-hairpin-helix domain-containing protein [Porticoccaceae bacterium]|nr:helix-hairpin-helix domain-containing protein [Porticoccaceae bacterium]